VFTTYQDGRDDSAERWPDLDQQTLFVLARQVAEVRAVAEKRLHATVARAAWRADPALPGDLVATLKTPEGKRYSEALESLGSVSKVLVRATR
jgi:hypothetical protein